MKMIGWALAAALALPCAPAMAQARDADDGASFQLAQNDEKPKRGRRGKQAAAAPGGDPARGMAETPALVASAGLRCTPSSAVMLGEAPAADGTKNTVYEVACSEGPGYVLIAKADKTLSEGYECFALKSGNDALAAEGKAQPNALTCKLPANADPIVGFRKLAQAAVPGCTIDEARYVGSSAATKEANYEVGCQGRPGVILKIAGPGSPAGTSASSTIPCDRLGAGSAVTCQYTTKAETLAPITALVSKSGRQCQVTDGRFVGASAGKPEEFYEAKCADGAGFMVVGNAGGTFNRIVDCARAQGIAGGCTLTDAVEAQNAEAGTYKQLAQKAGFNCDVDQYRLLGMQAGKSEVVELKCKNRPEGVVAFFPIQPTGTTTFHDCIRIGTVAANLKCSLTPAQLINTRLTQDVQSKGKTCQVDGFRAAGTNQSAKTDIIEVSCVTGPGFMVEYPQVTGLPQVVPARGVFTCAEARSLQGGCKLPGATG
jgi:hypothetical protein